MPDGYIAGGEMPDQTSTRSWRRFLRLKLSHLLVVVLLLAACLGWVVRSAHIQRAAVAAVHQAGGVVLYAGEYPRDSAIPAAGHRRPDGWWISSVSTTSVTSRL